MLYLGCHLSVSKGFENMAKEALSINANTLQFFTRNPRGGKAKDIDMDDVAKFLKILDENNFGFIVAHAPYTLNPCSKDASVREFAFNTMKDDMDTAGRQRTVATDRIRRIGKGLSGHPGFSRGIAAARRSDRPDEE